MAANSPPAPAICWHSQPQRGADRRVQPVCCGEVAGAKAAAPHRHRILTDLADVALHDLHAGRRHRVQECAVQCRSLHSAPNTGSKRRADAPSSGVIADAVERFTWGIYAQAVEMRQGMRHQSFTARLVYCPRAFFDHDDLESGLGAVQRRRESGRASTCHQNVDHFRLARAEFSTPIRVRNSAALRTVNTNPVIHALCTNGSAIPSITTAT